MSEGLLFLQAGGTIDKDYPAGETHHGYEFEIGAPAYRSVLARAGFPGGWSDLGLMQMDSLDMQAEHRQRIREAVLAAVHDRIIITHGTDTIGQTAAALDEIPGKTIILTGAMLPEKFRDSDADFNLGMAVAAARLSPPGVYIALYGAVTPAAEFENK